MGLRFGFIFLLSLLFFQGASPAHAQNDRERARTLFEAGVERFDAGEFDAALASFQQAYAIAPHPSVRINIANCLEQLGRYSEAVESYQKFLEESATSLKPAQREEVGRAIERLSRHFGTLYVELTPSAARLTVDGAVPERRPDGAILVSPGEHVLRASLSGRKDAQRVVAVEGGSSQTVSLELAPLPVAQPVVAEPERLEEHPPQEPYASPADEVAQRPSRVWLWTAAGAAALLTVGFATTAGLTYRMQREFDDASARSRDASLATPVRIAAYQDALDAKDRTERMALVSDVLLGSAVVATGATLVIWLVGKRRDDQEARQVRAEPLLSRHATGLSLRGKF